eukprot:3734977-Pyramimonas_sp.AAC.1
MPSPPDEPKSREQEASRDLREDSGIFQRPRTHPKPLRGPQKVPDEALETAQESFESRPERTRRG